jgi:hypothetical protein
MALKQVDKDKIKALGLDVDKLIAAVTSPTEVDYEVPTEVTVIKNADLAARDDQKISEGKKQGETIGEEKGKELAAKAFRKKFNLDDAAGKDVDKIVELVNGKLAAGDSTIKEQNAALLKDKEKLQSKIDEQKRIAKGAAFDSTLISFFPPGRSADLKDAERLALLKMDLTFEEQEGKTVVKRNGEVLKDKNTHAPLAPNQVVGDYFTERKWNAEANKDGGRGGEDQAGGAGGGNGAKKYSQAIDQWKKDNPGKSEVSPEAMDYVNGIAKADPTFDMYN